MPRPFKHVTGTYFLNARIPKDVVDRVRGTVLHLPVGDEVVAIKASTKVFLSLRTKDPNLARERFPVALAALTCRLTAVRDGPKPLTHKQLCALAGETYESRSLSIENDPEHGPHVVAGEARMAADDIAAWQYGDPDDADELEHCGEAGAREEIDHGAAVFFARIQRPYGAQLLALELNKDIVTPYVTMTRAQALEDLFGADADRVLADHGLVVDDQTRLKLLAQIGLAMGLVHRKVLANADGDYSVDFSGRFPVYEKPALQPATVVVAGGVSISRQIELFRSKSVGVRSQATLRRYTPCMLDFARFLKDIDIRLVTSDDAMRWAEKRRDRDGVSAAVVNGNDLCAVQALFSSVRNRQAASCEPTIPSKGSGWRCRRRPRTSTRNFSPRR